MLSTIVRPYFEMKRLNRISIESFSITLMVFRCKEMKEASLKIIIMRFEGDRDEWIDFFAVVLNAGVDLVKKLISILSFLSYGFYGSYCYGVICKFMLYRSFQVNTLL